MANNQPAITLPEYPKSADTLDMATYGAMYKRSVEDPEGFWAEQAEALDWIKKWDTVKDTSFTGDVSIKWFAGGQLNVAANCIDRWAAKTPDKTAIIWEGDDPNESRHISYGELLRETCRMANVLKSRGVKKGDRVTLYMPMIPEAAYAMLACARIGAIHSVVFAGFSPDSLRNRVENCESTLVITADESVRGGKKVPLKANVDEALQELPDVHTVLVVRRTGSPVNWQGGRDCWYHELAADAAEDCPPEAMDAEDPLFILYTSGSTGKPKGVLHTTGGYLLFAALTFKTIFDYREDDIHWCTADVGWVTGHSYILYGPLANGATTVMFEGVPTWPDASRCWQVVDKHRVTTFYTAPTAIRALKRQGDGFVSGTSRRSLRVLGTVGEPINPEAWEWYFEVVGDKRCPIVDTWWQTETGGVLITPLAGCTPMKPGSASLPFFGVQPVLVDSGTGEILEGEAQGHLCMKDSWPGQIRTVYGHHERMIDTYFSQYKGLYFSGDGCRRDADGFYWITGRVDDVLNVSGHRIGTAEVESAIVLHDDIAEAAVVGYPHDIKGQGIYAFVTPDEGVTPDEQLKKDVIARVRKELGAIVTIDILQWAPDLPKTRSGKIMRRILRKIAEKDTGNLGDTSTLLNPDCVQQLIEESRAA